MARKPSERSERPALEGTNKKPTKNSARQNPLNHRFRVFRIESVIEDFLDFGV
jgi:hypothetical protein